MLILSIVDILFPLFFIAGLGALYAGYLKPDMRLINHLSMNVFVPALIFTVLIQQNTQLQNYLGILWGGILVVIGSGILAYGLAKITGIASKTLVPPMMFSNAGNIGLPLLTLTFGPAILPVAAVLFLVENTLHFTLGSLLLSRRDNVLHNLLSPIILSTTLALSFNALGVRLPEALALPINMLSQVSIPLMIFSLGTRLASTNINDWRVGIIVAIAAPTCGVAIAILLIPWLSLTPQQAGALIIFGALPPAVLNFMFAERYQQEPTKVASVVVISHLITPITLPLALAYVIPRFV